MTNTEIFSIILSIISVAIGVWGIYFGLKEKKERLKLEAKVRSQLWATLDRARYVMGNKALLKEFDAQLTHPNKRHLWQLHQTASDLYISLIEQYLSQVDKFTYEDVKRLCDNDFINWRWQEKQWRILISQLPENRGIDPPGFFTPVQRRNLHINAPSGDKLDSSPTS
jgi:hypothetical protein